MAMWGGGGLWFVGAAPILRPDDPSHDLDTVLLVGVRMRRLLAKLTLQCRTNGFRTPVTADEPEGKGNHLSLSLDMI